MVNISSMGTVPGTTLTATTSAEDPDQIEREDPDPDQLERKDPDLHKTDKLDPNPHQSDMLDADTHHAEDRPKCMEYKPI